MEGERRKAHKVSCDAAHDQMRLNNHVLSQFENGGFLEIVDFQPKFRRCFVFTTVEIRRGWLYVTYTWVFVTRSINWQLDMDMVAKRKNASHFENVSNIRLMRDRSDQGLMVRAGDGNREIRLSPPDDPPILESIMNRKLREAGLR